MTVVYQVVALRVEVVRKGTSELFYDEFPMSDLENCHGLDGLYTD